MSVHDNGHCYNSFGERFEPSCPRSVRQRDHPSPLVQLAVGLEGVTEDDDEIAILHREIVQIANAVHQAYHGAHAPDACTVGWQECPRNICVRAQQLTDSARKRGHLSARPL
jgi:hypothetical protein